MFSCLPAGVAGLRFASRRLTVSVWFVPGMVAFGKSVLMAAMGQYFAVTDACTMMGVPWDWWRAIWRTGARRTPAAFLWCDKFKSPLGRFPLTTMMLLNSVAPVARRAQILPMNKKKWK